MVFPRALDWGLRTTLMIAVPAMLGLMLLSVPLVATLFQHGQFTAFDTRMAALSVFGLSFGLPAFALVKVVAAGVLCAAGHEDAGQARASPRWSPTCCQRRVPGDPVHALGAGGPAAGFGLGARWPRCPACISRSDWPVHWRAISTWHCCGTG